MNRQSVMGVIVMAASLISAQAVYAAPTGVHSPVNAIYVGGKLVKFTLRNDSSSPMKVKVGDAEMILAPGKPVAVKLAEGQTIVATETTGTRTAGEVLATTTADLSGATVVVR